MNSLFSCWIKMNIRVVSNVSSPSGWFVMEKCTEENLNILPVVNKQITAFPICEVLAVRFYSRRQKADSNLWYFPEGVGKQIVLELQIQVKSKQKDMNQQISANPLFPHFNSCIICQLGTVAAVSLEGHKFTMNNMSDSFMLLVYFDTDIKHWFLVFPHDTSHWNLPSKYDDW